MAINDQRLVMRGYGNVAFSSLNEKNGRPKEKSDPFSWTSRTREEFCPSIPLEWRSGAERIFLLSAWYILSTSRTGGERIPT